MIVLFSNFNNNLETYFTYGISFLSLIGLIMFVNVSLLVYKSINTCLRKLRMKKK